MKTLTTVNKKVKAYNDANEKSRIDKMKAELNIAIAARRAGANDAQIAKIIKAIA